MIYPIGIQSFEKLRNDGYVYVDKTAHIHRLVSNGSYYFLSRPRRFGKSLLISTMDAYFSGRKELFEGLAMEQLEQKWTKHPILHLDLNTGKYDTTESLDERLNNTLVLWEEQYGKRDSETTLALRFEGLVQRAYEKTGERVVILVDEYDKPMLQAIGNNELQENFRSTLKAFYSVLKTQDKYIKFAFLTGVTKFGKVSVFSDLNNLRDISMLPAYSDICGISEEEIHTYFKESVTELAMQRTYSSEYVYRELQALYGGFCFANACESVYNPCSLMRTFYSNQFRHYWYETGTPSFLKRIVLKQTTCDLHKLEQQLLQGNVNCASLYNEVDMIQNPIPMIFQSGYLTIKSYDKETMLYSLGFPNEEVRCGFEFLLKYL